MSDLVGKRVKPLPVQPLETDGVHARGRAGPSYAALLETVTDQLSTLESMAETIKSLEAEREALKVKHAQALEKAVEDARKDERASFETNSDAIVEAGLKALDSGRKSFEDFLAKSESLAVMLLDQALAPMFSDPSRMRETLASAIAKSVGDLGECSILNVRLNGDDFGDPMELMALQPELMAKRLSFEIDPALQAGECTFELLVGHYEISMKDHWTQLQALIGEAMRDAGSTPQLREVAE